MIEQAIRDILKHIGEDPDREGLKGTPARVVRSYSEIFSGYAYDDENIASVLTTFTDGTCDEMVLLRDIDFVSCCEHHMLPFSGRAHIAYIPNGEVVGISKLARILDIFSRRLQIQERLTQQITTTLDNYLNPLGSACIIEGVHSCMVCRGVRKQNSVLVTSSLTGEFKEHSEVRAELFSLVKG